MRLTTLPKLMLLLVAAAAVLAVSAASTVVATSAALDPAAAGAAEQDATAGAPPRPPLAPASGASSASASAAPPAPSRSAAARSDAAGSDAVAAGADSPRSADEAAGGVPLADVAEDADPPADSSSDAEQPTPDDVDEVASDDAATSPAAGGSDSNAVEVRPTLLEPGDEGEAVAALQRRLRDLGYWLGDVDGAYGALTRQAVLAFQGVEGLARDGIAGPAVHRALADATRPQAPLSDGLTIDLSEQVLRVVEDGRVRWVLHTSTGTGERYSHPDGGTRLADTPPGDFTITRRVDGWRDAPLGRLYRPAYFNGGIAVHGYPAVPAQPASHGCARVSMAAIDMLWRIGAVDEGERVLVH